MTSRCNPSTAIKAVLLNNITPALKKGIPNRRILVAFPVNGAEYSLHATKGWRVRRLPAA